MKPLKPFLLIFSIVLFLMQDCVFAEDQLNPYRIIVKLKNMPAASSLAAISPHLTDLENTLGIKINQAVPIVVSMNHTKNIINKINVL